MPTGGLSSIGILRLTKSLSRYWYLITIWTGKCLKKSSKAASRKNRRNNKRRGSSLQSGKYWSRDTASEVNTLIKIRPHSQPSNPLNLICFRNLFKMHIHLNLSILCLFVSNMVLNLLIDYLNSIFDFHFYWYQHFTIKLLSKIDQGNLF